MKALTIIASVALCSSTYASVLWVDKANGNNSTAAKDDESKPYATIQGAVDAASSGDEIRVKPGVYDSGYKGGGGDWGNCRVWIDAKRLKVVSTKGPDVTHIVGKIGSRSDGLGSSLGDCVRCVGVRNGAGTIIEGFTLRDGSVQYLSTSSDTNPRDCGGAVMSAGRTDAYVWHPTNTFVVGCVVSNCVGQRGGAFRGVTAVRSRIEGNRAAGGGGGNVGRMCNFINCLMTGNYGTTLDVFTGHIIANCTIVGNAGQMQGSTTASARMKCVNSIFLGNCGSGEQNVKQVALTNCLTYISGYTATLYAEVNTIKNASPYQFVSPLAGDWRILRGSQAETHGDASLLEVAQSILPEGVDAYVDLFGNPIPKSGAIAAGCIQTVADPLPHGGVMFSDSGTVIFNGKRVYGKKMYAFAEAYPTQFVVQAVNKGNPAIFAFTVGSSTLYPTMDDTAYIAPQLTAGSVVTCEVQTATKTLYVDPNPEIGSDTAGDGSASAPYFTLYKAMTKASASYVVRAAEGVYDQGGNYTSGASNRVSFTTAVRLLGAGRGKSFIKGAPSPTTGGLGPYATRCVYRSSSTGCVQGFTITDGYVDSGNDSVGTRGGGVYGNATYSDVSFRVLDCTITNCWAERGGAGYSCAYERCHITDCHANNGVIRYARLYSCLVDGLDGKKGTANSFGIAYHSTFIGKDTSTYVIAEAGFTMTNCFVMTQAKLTGPASACTTYAWNIPSFSASEVTYADPKLVDVAGRDYRPTVFIYRGTQETYPSPLLGNGTWVRFSSINMADFDGKPLNLINGRPTAGAFQWPEVTVIKPGFILMIQ